jgi:imidazolonepropionase-like amidohydrolase
MRRRTLLLYVGLLPLAGCAGAKSAGAVRPLVIANVTVIDMTGAPARTNVDVVIEGNRIAAITRAGNSRVSRGARVVDGRGKYLIPGLWDMHTHLSSYGEEALAALVPHGVLAVRDVGGKLIQLDAWRAEIDRGARRGPRIFRAGPFVDGPKEMSEERASMTIVARNPDEARAAVTKLKAEGVDLIKSHNGLSREAYFALADECRRQSMLLATHLPTSVRIAEASDAGASSLEHVETMTESIVFAGVPAGGQPTKDPLTALDELTDERADELFARFARNGTWFTPTLVAYRSFMQEAVDLAPRDPRYTADAAGRTKMFNRFVELVGRMHRSGVPLLAGTDFGPHPSTVPYPVPRPGSDLHDELELLVRAGLTPMEALQTATSGAARHLRVADRLGTIEVGKDADLVLLDADPLANIANTRQIRGVVLRGVFLEKAQLALRR